MPSLVQSKPGIIVGATMTVTLASPTTAGNCLVVVAACAAGGTIGTVTAVTLGGAAGNFGQLITPVGSPASSAETLNFWADPNCAGGQTSVTITSTGGTGGGVVILATVYEFSGLAATLAGLLDQHAGVDGGGTQASSFSTGATSLTSQASEVYVGAVAAYNPTITGPASPWVNAAQQAVNSSNLVTGYQVASSAGTPSYAGTFSAAAYYECGIVTLKAAAGSGGAAAWSGSGTMPAGAAVAGGAAWGGTGSLAAAEKATFQSGAAMTGTGTLTATGGDIPVFSAVYGSTAGDGTQTWTVTSALNGPGTSTLRILPPSSPSGSYPHSFLFALPVSTGTDATYGDPISVIGDDLGAHNAYNTTVVVPSFPIQPWYADNPGNTAQNQESFMLALAAWMSTSSFASGGEKNYLIGFSKSGIGGQGLIFHRPDVWAACASWDAPFCMTDYDGTDPTNGGTVGGGSATCYGTSANFTTNYELSSGHLAAWAPGGGFTTRERLWIGGYQAFQADVSAYQSELATAGILYDGTWNSLDSSHAWHDDWVADALAAVMVMPEQQSGAAMAGTGTLTAGSRLAGTVPLSGTGTFSASARLPGGVAWSGGSTLAGSPQLPAGAAWSGAGSCPASPQLAPLAGFSGGGTLAAGGELPAGAALDGEGSLRTSASRPGTAGWAGAGALTAGAGSQAPGAAGLDGEGTFAAVARLASPAAFTGLGTLSPAGLRPSGGAWSGGGALGVPVLLPGAAALDGEGAFSPLPALAAAVALSGVGRLSAAWSVTGTSAVALGGTSAFSAAYAQSVTAGAALDGTGTFAVQGSALPSFPGTCLAADYLACSVIAADYLAFSALAADRAA